MTEIPPEPDVEFPQQDDPAPASPGPDEFPMTDDPDIGPADSPQEFPAQEDDPDLR